MADVLPGYLFANGRYRNEATGRFVSRADINGLLDSQIQGAENRLQGLATAFYEGKIAPAVFVEQVCNEERRLFLQNRALGAGGFDRLDFRAYGAIGGSLRGEYAKIIGTARDVADGKVSLPQLLNRIRGYAGAARSQFYKAQRDTLTRAPEGMVSIERRILGDANHCQDCLNYYELGWQPRGSLPVPSEACACRNHCRCSLISRDVAVADADQWIGTKR